MLALAFTPSTTAVAGNLVLTALLGLLPLVAFFVLLGVFKIATHWCALASLAIAFLASVLGFHMPAPLSLLSGVQGAVFGLAVIIYIVIMAVWLHNLTERSGRSADVRAVFSLVGKGDMRVQALLIGFSFCGLMEGLAGFGAPVAIACAMLLALGLKPIKAAVVTAVGNALNVAFGAMAIPLTTTAALGGVQADALGQTAGRITPLFLVWMPVLLLAILDGVRGVKEVWPAALVAGIGMAGGHYVTSHFLSYQLTAVVASLVSFALVALLMRVWQPHTPAEQHSGATEGGLTGSRVTLALLPYWLVVVIFMVAKLWRIGVDIPAWLSSTDLKIKMPGLYGRILTPDGAVSPGPTLSIPLLSSPGTMLLVTGAIVSVVYALNSSNGRFAFSIRRGVATLGQTIVELRWAILTITAVMALAYVMNLSGQTVAVGTWLAGTGAAFAFFSPVLGWLGTAVTGSATSSGALFANLQTTVATQAHMNPQLLLAANEVGGGIGKIVSPQNLAIAATAVKEPGLEPTLLRTTAPYSIGLVVLLGIVVVLASGGVLGFILA